MYSGEYSGQVTSKLYIVDIVPWVIFIMTHFLERVKEQTPMTWQANHKCVAVWVCAKRERGRDAFLSCFERHEGLDFFQYMENQGRPQGTPRWWFQFQIFWNLPPLFGEDEPILTIIFFRWVETFNHQLEHSYLINTEESIVFRETPESTP